MEYYTLYGSKIELAGTTNICNPIDNFGKT